MKKRVLKLTQATVMLIGIASCVMDEKRKDNLSENIGPYGKDLAQPDISLDELPTEWIKPMWPNGSQNPKMDIFDTCELGESEGQKDYVPIPNNVTAMQYSTIGTYVANVSIYNKDSIQVKHFIQHFGLCGERSNANRRNGGQIVSFIGWDGKNDSGIIVKDSVLVWKVDINHPGSEEIFYLSISNRNYKSN